MAQQVKNPPNAGDSVDVGSTLGQKSNPLVKEMATHPALLPGKSHTQSEPGGLQSIGWQIVVDATEHTQRRVKVVDHGI